MEKKNIFESYLKEIAGQQQLSDQEERELGRRIQQGDARAVDRLVSANLKFVIPAGTEDGLTSFTSKLSTNYNVIPEAVADGNTQNYAKSSTIYYPVAQPENSEVGFTFHVSYKLIAEDNGEEITVHNARVYVPAKNGSEFIAAWQPNTKYTYTFKITKDSKGTTNPDDTTIDITKPDVPATPTVYPIVFDGATVVDYDAKDSSSDF